MLKPQTLPRKNKRPLVILSAFSIVLGSCTTIPDKISEVCVSDAENYALQCCDNEMKCYSLPWATADKYICMEPQNFEKTMKAVREAEKKE